MIYIIDYYVHLRLFFVVLRGFSILILIIINRQQY
jgi:hypothetical protein